MTALDRYQELIDVVRRLRKECPWDREQTNDSIKANTLEEAYEVVDAIDEGDDEELSKELGDLLLHVVFHASIAEEEERFTLEDVERKIIEKLVRRHPHIFGEERAEDSKTVIQNWEALKKREGRKSTLDGLPLAMPALLRAYRAQEKASNVGFDWSDKRDVWAKIEEELAELKEAERDAEAAKIEEEFGDLLFSIVNYSRHVSVNPEDALRKAVKKFERRFRRVEETLAARGKSVHESTLEEMDEIWDEGKRAESRQSSSSS